MSARAAAAPPPEAGASRTGGAGPAARWSAFWAAAPLNRLYLSLASAFVAASFVSDFRAFTADSPPDAVLQVTGLVMATLGFLAQWWRSTVAVAVLLLGAALTLPLAAPVSTVVYLPLVLAGAVATARSRTFAGVAVGLSLLWAVVQPPFATGRADAVWLLVLLVAVGGGMGLSLRLSLLRRERDRVSLAAAERRAREAAERERRVLARDLHDIVAHNLTIITMQARTARFVGTPEASSDALDVVADSARDALVDLRRMLAVLQEDGAVEPGEGPTGEPDAPPGAAATDLAAGAARMAAELERLGVAAAARVELGDVVVPLGVRTALYRVMQEAVTNVAKHAGPGASCRIGVAVEGRAVVLTVEDARPAGERTARGARAGRAGRGGEPEWNSSGVGVRSMRDRVEAYGGELEAGPVPGGWRVRATVPLAAGA